MKVFRDLSTILNVNRKTFLANKLAVTALVVVTMAFAIISGTLVKEYDKKSSLPIGVLDKDQSDLSKHVMDQVKKTNGFVVHEWSEEELKRGLEEEKLYAYFVIDSGFEQKVKANQAEQLVKMYYLKDYNFVSILSDIFAKSMMKEVILYRGNALYDSYIERYKLEEVNSYLPYVEEMEQGETQGIFENSYYKVEDGTVTQSVETKNSILSNQIFIGMVAIFGSFLSMFLVICLRKSRGLKRRLRISLISPIVWETGEALSLMLAEGIVALAATVYLCTLLKISLFQHGAAVFFRVILLFAILSFVFAIASKLIEKETTYQFLCVLFIFIMGGLSIMASIGQITIPFLGELAKNIPNYWFITDITDIILAGKATIRFFPVGVLAGLAFIYTSITDIKLKVLAR